MTKTGGGLTIRKEQFDALQGQARRSFASELEVHLAEYAPQLCAAAGDANVRKFVSAGLERAKAHGFARRGPKKLYVDLMASLGWAFDSDPLHPWATAALAEPDEDEMARSGRLYKSAIEYLDGVAGPDMSLAIEALQRGSKATFSDFLGANATADSILNQFHVIYPQKYDAGGPAAMRTVLQGAAAEAKRLKMASREGAVLLASLMFAFGHGVTSDPLYPWVLSTLENGTEADAPQRIEKLAARTKAYMAAAAANLTRPSSHA